MSLFLNLLFETDSYPNEYLLAKFGFDTAENEPCNNCPLSASRSPRYTGIFCETPKMLNLPYEAVRIVETVGGNFVQNSVTTLSGPSEDPVRFLLW